MKRLLCLAALACGTAHAACSVNLHVAALHGESGYETMTPGVGLLCDTPYADVRGSVGFFSNSLGHMSGYVGAAWQPWEVKGVRLGFFGGAINGYGHGLMPMAAALVSFDLTPQHAVNLIVLPAIRGKTPLTLALTVEFRL